ncbi:MAG: hypothetical protein M0Z77_07870 [Thermoplasmatales archaeon]|nr:hypothetical protein [Candidatus Thermoplasmatota archaeon]MDA8055544.1 hypothetical protein [Thermoplasmatales archaeon]
MSNDRPKIVSVSPLSSSEETYIKAAENQAGKSFDVLRTFAGMMISVQSGFIAVYFAILKFIGINAASGTGFLPLVLIFPPLFFGLGIVFFIFVALPILEKMRLDQPDKIVEKWNRVLMIKFVFIIAGLVSFFIAIVGIIYVGMSVLA